MRPVRLDPATADRLAAGLLASDDTPPGYGAVAALLDEARGATTAPDPAWESVTVGAMQATLAGDPRSAQIPWRKKMLPARLSVRTAALASVLVLAGGSAAAAATGSLPGPAQHTAATLLSHIGISVPGNDGAHGANDQGTNTGTGSGPNSHALYGLCTAAAAHAKHHVHPHSSVFPSSTTCSTVVKPGGNANDGTNDSTDDSTPDNGTAPNGAGQPSDTPVGPPSSVPVGAPTTPPSSTPPADEPPVSTPGHPGSGSRP